MSEVKDAARLPLQGVLVVSLEQAVAAPLCTCHLADAGARVLKVERAEGDFARHYDQVVNGQSAYFVWTNRGKESIVLDIKDPDDRALLRRMIDRADVFVQNLAPGALERVGLHSAELRREHPELITVDISGYGEEGPYREMKAYDLLVQGETGLASITGSPAEPGRVGVSICDISCGMYAYAAILEALLARNSTGQGQAIRLSLFDSLADWMTVPLLQYDYTGQGPSRVGMNHPGIAPYGAYRCGDGELVILSIQNEREWHAFCAGVLEQPQLAAEPRFASNVARCRHRAELDRIILSTFEGSSRQAILGRLDSARIAYGALNTVADFARHPQLRRMEVASEAGPVRLVASPAIASSGPRQPGPVPRLGEHGEAIRREFSLPAA